MSEEECTVWGALALTLRISCAAGIAPLRVSARRGAWQVAVSIRACQYSYAILVTLNVIIAAAVVADMQNPGDSVRMRSSFSAAIWMVDVVIVMVIVNIAVYSARRRMTNMIEYFNSINMLTLKLNDDKIILQKSEKRKSWFLLGYLLVIFTQFIVDYLSIVYKTVVYSSDRTLIVMYACYYWELFMTFMLELQFVYIALHITTTLNSLNRVLKSFVQEVQYKESRRIKPVASVNFVGDTNLKLNLKAINTIIDSTLSFRKHNNIAPPPAFQFPITQDVIRHLSLTYSTICNTIRDVDKDYGLLVVLLLTSTLVHLVVTPYNFITHLLHSPNVPFMILELSWIILHIAKTVLIVEPGHRTQKEIAVTHVIVGELMGHAPSLPSSMANELDLLFKQITLNKVSYAPLGLCTLTRPLIATVLGGVTTYLVIIVQFQSYDKDAL